MKRTALVAAAVLVGLLISACLRFVPDRQDGSRDHGAGSRPDASSHRSAPSPDQSVGHRPNILFILTDDMRASDLQYMPITRNLLEKHGVTFTNAFVTRSLCCPSRATILRGQYTHNHNVWVNVPPAGSYWRFHAQELENSTVATWLDGAGYDTVFIGKYLNRYSLYPSAGDVPTTYVPPGWDRWYGWEGDYEDSGTAYHINENGRIATYQRSDVDETDVYARTAERYIRQTVGGAPFFMYLSTNSPHEPAYYAPRYASMFSDQRLPRPPSFDEGDVSDKPDWVSKKRPLPSTLVSGMAELYRDRLRALQSVDEMVGNLVGVLRDAGELSDTYLVFSSDNGVLLGEHRLHGKGKAYEEAVHVPLLVRGPGVPRGAKRSQLVLNNDLAPTFAGLAGADTPTFVDGRSLEPLLGAHTSASWRSAFLIEHRRLAKDPDVRNMPDYDAVRTTRYLYVEYPATGEKELYDLYADPYELTNAYASASPALVDALEARLGALGACAGVECKRSEDGG